MAKKVVRAEIALLRDDWFLPVQKAAIDRTLIKVEQGVPWRAAAAEGLDETFKEFGLEGINALIHSEAPAIEAAPDEALA